MMQMLLPGHALGQPVFSFYHFYRQLGDDLEPLILNETNNDGVEWSGNILPEPRW